MFHILQNNVKIDYIMVALALCAPSYHVTGMEHESNVTKKLVTSSPLHTIAFDEPTSIDQISFNASGDLMSVVKNNSIAIYKTRDGSLIDSRSVPRVTQIAWHPHNPLEYIENTDIVSRIYSLENKTYGKLIPHGMSHAKSVFSLNVMWNKHANRIICTNWSTVKAFNMDENTAVFDKHYVCQRCAQSAVKALVHTSKSKGILRKIALECRNKKHTYPWDAAFSNNKRYVAETSGVALRKRYMTIRDNATKSVIFQTSDNRVAGPVWSCDDRYVIWLAGFNKEAGTDTVVAYDVQTGTTTQWTFPNEQREIHHFAANPKQPLFAYYGHGKEINIIDPNNDQTVITITGAKKHSHCFWSPCGRFLAVDIYRKNEIRIYDFSDLIHGTYEAHISN